jgi:hypothetical protein
MDQNEDTRHISIICCNYRGGSRTRQLLDGQSLLHLCSGNSADKNACTAYIQGASDQWNLYRALTRTTQCGPETLTGGQLRDVVVVYLQKHPEHLIDSAAGLVVEAMTAAWKCK